MISSLLVQAAPLLLAALGALWSELAGFLAVSIEGWMSFGGFFAYIFTLLTHSALAGTALAAVLAGLLNWITARYVLHLGADPFIVGLALNLGISGGTAALSLLIFGSGAVARSFTGAPPDAGGSIPADGFQAGFYFALLAAAAVLLSAFALRRTPFGLRLLAVGLSPQASGGRGLNAGRYRALSWALAAFFAALGGAALCFRVGVWTADMASGRGWLALAAVFLAFRRMRGIAAAALIFALSEKFSIDLQKTPGAPAQALLGMPQFLALVLYAISRYIQRKRKE